MLEVGLEDRQADPEQLNQDVHLVILSRLNWKKTNWIIFWLEIKILQK